MQHKIILASESPARLQLLSIIGVKDITIQPANIDEEPLKNEPPHKLASRLAKEKALKIASQANKAIIIAADSVVCVGTRILPKALTDEDVRYCLSLLSGRRHKVITAVTIIDSESQIIRSKIAEAIIKFKRMTSEEIEYYISTKEGINKAGGYAIQGSVQSFIPFLQGQVSTVIGLPLYEVKNMLLSFGYKFSEGKNGRTFQV